MEESSSGAGVVAHPILRVPPEIFNRILFFAGHREQSGPDQPGRDNNSLGAISMTCRLFRKPAQAILLRRVFVRNNRQCARIARWLVGSPVGADPRVTRSWRNSCGTQSPAVIKSVVFGRIAVHPNNAETFLQTDGVVALLKLLPQLQDLVFAKLALCGAFGYPDGLLQLDALEDFTFKSPRLSPPAWLIDTLRRSPFLQRVNYSFPSACNGLGLPRVRSLRMVCRSESGSIEPLAWPSLRVLAVTSHDLAHFCIRYPETLQNVQALRLAPSYAVRPPSAPAVPTASCPCLDLVIDERQSTGDAIPLLAWSKARTFCVAASSTPELQLSSLPRTVQRVVVLGAPANFVAPGEAPRPISVEAVPFLSLDEEALLDRGVVLPSPRRY